MTKRGGKWECILTHWNKNFNYEVNFQALRDSEIDDMADMDQIDQIKPLIPESSTSESTTVEVVLNALRDETLRIPDYQRDSDQWDQTTKSLFVESVINNLSIPAFFFEVILEGIEKNDVIDGQQRLTTLSEFYKNKFRMVDSDNAPYLSPNSVHYAGKTFDELPAAYRQAFKTFRLTIIKLRNLGDMRLEIFRRINQGGTPLSGQDIRLAYYGSKSPSLMLIRLAGVYDFVRTPKDIAKKFSIEYPQSKGRWGGIKGYKAQLLAVKQIVGRIVT